MLIVYTKNSTYLIEGNTTLPGNIYIDIVSEKVIKGYNPYVTELVNKC